MITAALLLGLLASTPTPDPRPEIVRLQLEEGSAAALEKVVTAIRTTPELADELGLPYLEGVLLLDTGRREPGLQALADSVNRTPSLDPWARLRLAVERETSGDTAVAAALAAGVLGSSPPTGFLLPAVSVLERTLDHDGDCRLLLGLRSVPLKGEAQRRLQSTRAACARRQGRLDEEGVMLFDLLDESTADDVAYRAAVRLLERVDLDGLDTHRLDRLGNAFYDHRVFETAVDLLSRVARRLDVGPPPAKWTDKTAFESRYALARSLFWLGRYEDAAAQFAALAKASPKPVLAAKSLYQQARCHELRGATDVSSRNAAWERAVDLFNSVHRVDPKSGWASAGLIAGLRLQWLLGHEKDAAATYALLEKTGRRDNAVRALLFLAASDLVQGRADRAGPWLDRATRLQGQATTEIRYWQARLSELERDTDGALETYLRIVAEDPYHPFGQAAGARLADDGHRALLGPVIERLRSAEDEASRVAAWLALNDGAVRENLAAELRDAWSKDDRAAPFLGLSGAPVDTWPLWGSAPTGPDQLLLGLGRFEAVGVKPLRSFPIAEPELAFAAARATAKAGDMRGALYIAEILQKRLPEPIPLDMTSRAFQETLYPFGYSLWIVREAKKHGVEPFLLAGLIREESRFDPKAFSAAAARGLTQFIYSTARSVADENGISLTSAQDIHRPEVAVALGAAYLSRLFRDLDGRIEAVVAAYNAGEPQAVLWRHYCFSDDPAEYWSKIAFKETRNYVRKVLKSRAHYRHLYGDRSVEDRSVEDRSVEDRSVGDRPHEIADPESP